jgi:hypothetical protein
MFVGKLWLFIAIFHSENFDFWKVRFYNCFICDLKLHDFCFMWLSYHVSVMLGADYMDRASPVNRAEKCHENLPWAAK